jgi:hypothetical protein
MRKVLDWKRSKILRNVEHITHGFNNTKTIETLFLDIEPAFDKVWTTELIAKRIKAKIPLRLIHIIHNYLQNRSFSVMHGNFCYSLRPIKAGVPRTHTLQYLY